MSKRYQIDKITDIFQIPKDRFEYFLVDFKAYYETGNDMAQLLSTTGKVLKTPVEVLPSGMTWIDDGKNNISVTIKTTATKSDKNRDLDMNTVKKREHYTFRKSKK